VHSQRYIRPHLGGVKLSELTSLHVQQFYADLHKAGVSASMQRKAGVSLGVALQSAARLGVIPVNPARGVKKPRVEKKEIFVLDMDQLKAFLDAAKVDRLYALYAVALDSGAREGELFGLYWSDVDFTVSCIHVRRSLEEIEDTLRVKDCKTKQSRRQITLSPFALGALQGHRKAMLAEGNYRSDGPVFCNSEGGFLRKSHVLDRSFKPVLKRAGLPHFRVYDLRHTCATLLLLAGENPKVVSERLGHGTIALTLDTYSHVLPTMQVRAAAKLDAIFQATTTPKTAKG
jgi:integrase